MKPWERYRQIESDQKGPWTKYQDPAQPANVDPVAAGQDALFRQLAAERGVNLPEPAPVTQFDNATLDRFQSQFDRPSGPMGEPEPVELPKGWTDATLGPAPQTEPNPAQQVDMANVERKARGIVEDAQTFGSLAAKGVPLFRLADLAAEQLTGQRPVEQAAAGSYTGLADFGGAIGSAGARLGPGESELSHKINLIRQRTQEINREEGGKVGELASGVVSSLAPAVTVGRIGGVRGVAAWYGQDAYGQAMTDARERGLSMEDATRFANKAFAIEFGVTLLAGQLAEKLGVSAGAEAFGSIKGLAFDGINKALQKAGIATLFELGEESTIEVLNAVNEYAEGVDPQALESENIIPRIGNVALQTLATMGVSEGSRVAAAKAGDRGAPPEESAAISEPETQPALDIEPETAGDQRARVPVEPTDETTQKLLDRGLTEDEIRQIQTQDELDAALGAEPAKTGQKRPGAVGSGQGQVRTEIVEKPASLQKQPGELQETTKPAQPVEAAPPETGEQPPESRADTRTRDGEPEQTGPAALVEKENPFDNEVNPLADDPAPPIHRQSLSEPISEAPTPKTKLPGGRRSGGTPIISETASEIIGLADRAAKSVNRFVRNVPTFTRRIAQRGANFIESLDEPGKKLANEIRTVDRRAAKHENNDLLDIKAQLKGLTHSDRVTVGQLVNERISPDDAPDNLVKRADAIREVLDRGMNEASALGMTRLVRGARIPLKGSGKALPQVPNERGRRILDEAQSKGLSSAEVAAAATQMVRDGRAEDMQSALSKLLNFRYERLRGFNPYLESSRVELPLDMVEWDPAKVVPHTLHRNWLTVEGVREWGNNFEKAAESIAKIKKDVDPGTGKAIADFMGIEFGVGGFVPAADSAIAGTISNYETIARLGFSVLSVVRNTFQRFANTAMFPLSSQLRALKDFPPVANLFMESAKKIKEQMIRSGAVRGASSLAEIEQSAAGHRLTDTALKMFSSAERGNQTYAALVAKYAVEADMKRLANMKGRKPNKVIDAWLNISGQSKAAIERRAKKLGLTNEQLADIMQSGRELTQEELETVMSRAVLDTQFPLTVASRRLWWSGHPWARLLGKFKPFGLDQVGMVYRHVVSEAKQGNVAPMARFMIWTLIAGEIYNILRDLIVGDEESITTAMLERPDQQNPKDVSIRMARNFFDGGGVGMLADLSWGIGDYFTGPVGSSMENLGEAVADTARDPRQAITAMKQLATKEISVSRQVQGIVNRLESALIKDTNDYNKYRIWRQRSYEWRDEKKGKGIIEKSFLPAIEGMSEYDRTARSLSYDFASQNITVGDVEDAAGYLARIMRNVEPGERKKLLKAIRGSANARSPLGKVAERDRGEFLRPFTQEQRSEARRLQRNWMQRYESAINKAMKKAGWR